MFEPRFWKSTISRLASLRTRFEEFDYSLLFKKEMKIPNPKMRRFVLNTELRRNVKISKNRITLENLDKNSVIPSKLKAFKKLCINQVVMELKERLSKRGEPPSVFSVAEYFFRKGVVNLKVSKIIIFFHSFENQHRFVKSRPSEKAKISMNKKTPQPNWH